MRSPRFTNRVTESKSEFQSSSKSNSESESLSLSLIVNADEHQPVALKILLPELLGQPHLRRSPRFIPPLQNDAAIVYSSPNSSQSKMQDERNVRKSMKQPRLVHASSLRSSPRLNSGSANEIQRTTSGLGSGISGKTGSGKVKSCSGRLEARNWEQKSLRRSSRFSGAIIVVETSSATAGVAKRQRSRGPELPLNAELEDQKMILDGKSIEEKFCTRSPRLASTQSECKSFFPNTSSQKMLESLEKQCLRSGSRNNSNLLSDATPCLPWHKDSDKGTMPFKHFDSKLLGGKHLRQSPTLHSSTRELDNEASMENHDVKPSDSMKFRRSPRFSSPSGNENFKMIQQKGTSKLTHKKQKSSKGISTSIGPSKSTNEWHLEVSTTLGNSSPSVPDEKCLTCSSETMISVSEAENGRINCDCIALSESDKNPPKKKFKISKSLEDGINDHGSIPSFIGKPIPDDEAQKRWGWRYELKKKSKDHICKINDDEEDEMIVNVECHYAQAKIGDCIFSLEDCAYIKGEEGQRHVGKIVEFFQTTDKENYFRVQWFYKIEDTIVQDAGEFHDKRRLFYSTVMNDNPIDCIMAKVNVTHITPRVGLKFTSISPSDFYYDMEYCVDYSTFRSLPTDNSVKSGELSSPVVLETLPMVCSTNSKNNIPGSESQKAELTLLDLYSGCGGMSTGLCLGAKVSSVNLVTRWAVDSDRSACQSLSLNHPETQVRNESAEEFLELLKEWEKLCRRYKVNDADRTRQLRSKKTEGEEKQMNNDDIPDDEFEVSKLVDISYGDPSGIGKQGLYFKVHWKGYSSSEDTWERFEDLRKCQEAIQDFVRHGMKSKILPLPGDVDVICGGPPCQGISGYNRYRNTTSPLDDERNRQIVVFMDIVKFLKPKYVLMENVVDILRLDKASLGRYALSRLIHMNYQARLGIVAAGCYGLPQFRLRVFLWGAHPSEVLPQFPLPTHDVIIRYWPPPEFERNTVAYDEDQPRELEKAIVLQDAISDLPVVTNGETREEMSYQNPPETEFQIYIRSTKYDMTGSILKGTTEKKPVLYDHRAYLLHEDDYLRVCQIPKRKGANFRDLPGVIVGADNVVRRNPKENSLLPSGKPLVPDYCFTFEQGKSKRPFARLWWDETVPTVLTYPSCHNQVVLHPEQDRVLTIREFARLQGFPDYYRFHGNIKERYCQIGNAVAVSVSRALGYALGMAYRKLSGNEHLMTLPPKFSNSNYLQLSNDQQDNTD